MYYTRGVWRGRCKGRTRGERVARSGGKGRKSTGTCVKEESQKNMFDTGDGPSRRGTIDEED